MGLRIVLLLLFSVFSVVLFLLAQVRSIITISESRNVPPHSRPVGHSNSSLKLNDQDDNIMSFIQVSTNLSSCLLSNALLCFR